MKKVSILDMAEDLIDEDLACNIGKNQTAISKDSSSKKSKSTKCSSLEGLIADIANILKMPVEELDDWINEAVIPENVLKIILTAAKRLKLNPVLGQISWELNREGGYEIFIPIDGWIAMIHREPSFEGISFNQSNEIENGIPVWMECTIYRSNLTHPMTVREYYVEVRGDHPVWQKMPRRMLRHKTLHQCVRLAFGIAIPEFKIKAISLKANNRNIPKKRFRPLNAKDILKSKLAF